MSTKLFLNGLVFIVLTAIPLIAELSTTTVGNVSGAGFSVLLYEPFSFAYVLFAGTLFISLNIYILANKKEPVLSGIGTGIILLFIWFIFAFLCVGQLHLSLGGKL